jgi:hypothetical protein
MSPDNRVASDAVHLSAGQLLAAYRTLELSPVEVVDGLASRIAELDHLVGTFTTLCLERAREEARAAEAAYRRGDSSARHPRVGNEHDAKPVGVDRGAGGQILLSDAQSSPPAPGGEPSLW